jgi:acetate kinase
MRVLVVNSGSSTLKVRLLEGDELISSRDVTPLSRDDLTATLRTVGDGGVDAVGHRVVHGGRTFSDAVVITPEVEEEIRSLASLAPLHQLPALEGIELAREVFAQAPHVACFDTAFHARMPESAAAYAVPREWREDLAVRRYGFHGLSHAYAARRCAEMTEASTADLRIVTCHLGAGASLAAVSGGRSVDTTMGFTPLEGLVMATRSGNLDPAVPLWLLDNTTLSAAEIADELEHRSGLMALAGTPDMREVLERADRGDGDAALALDVYVHRLRAAIAQMAAAMHGLDALVFTGGVGERAPVIRTRAADGLGFMGVGVDESNNGARTGDFEVTAAGARVRAFVVTAREDIEIARQTRRALGAG